MAPLTLHCSMNSIGADCGDLKKAYEDCFNSWFSDKFLRGSREDTCAPLFSVYQSCVKKAMQERQIGKRQQTGARLTRERASPRRPARNRAERPEHGGGAEGRAQDKEPGRTRGQGSDASSVSRSVEDHGRVPVADWRARQQMVAGVHSRVAAAGGASGGRWRRLLD